MSEFFIKRPVFAWVIAILIMMSGALAILSMPVEQYPNIAPPSVSISTSLPGASAETLENSVTQVIEQSLTGIDNLRYFSADSDSDGNVRITLTFEPKTDADIAQVQVQNKLQAAMPLLPQSVQEQGVRINKSNNNFLLVIGLYSSDDSLDEADLGDILLSDVKDNISRINGVGNVTTFGNPRSMRIWVDPSKLYAYKLTIAEVLAAIRAQNNDVSAGQIGGLPAVKGQQINATINAQSRLQTVDEFKKIIIRADIDGSQVTLADVARIEIGKLSYNTIARYKGHPASGMAVILASGANALDTAKEVKAKMAELEKTFPKGVKLIYPLDSTPFIKLSIEGVVKTLIEAVALVILVMLIFLQNFRATLIPAIAVPVVLLGTFAILASLGFTINTLTMFATVLVIGLLVDDAIVVVENVERIMREEGLPPREATQKSMKQITGALIGIALVLSAVFVPMGFFGGSAGEIYRQFSVTIVSAMTLSVLVALILSPSLCASVLKNDEHEGGFARFFNSAFDKLRNFYVKLSSVFSRNIFKLLIIYFLFGAGAFYLFKKIPTSFLPTEDQGMMYLLLSAPSGATIERTGESLRKVEKYFLEQEPNVEHLFTVAGFSFAGRAQNAGFGFIGLRDWDLRKDPKDHVAAISGRAMGALSTLKDATVFTIFPPPIRELGNASGFDLQLVDYAGLGHKALIDARNAVLFAASKNPILAGVRPNGLEDVAEYKIEIDYAKAAALGVSVADINQTLQAGWGSSYVNDFLDKGRIKKVYLQGEASSRMNPSDIDKWFVRNKEGEMVSFGSFTSSYWSYGSPKLERFNGISSVNIQGGAIPGVSSGDAMLEMEKIMSEVLPKGLGFAWSGISYEERTSGSQTFALYIISLLVVFLSLAALYESWSVPFAVILTVPFGIFGALLFSLIFKMSNDVYFQVGLLTTIGLSAKNAILIVEFARRLYEEGEELIAATIQATKQRFRPIIMTSMAFMLGITPLATANGAGSASQQAIGIGVMGGMIFATFVATLFVPMFYVLVQTLRKKITGK